MSAALTVEIDIAGLRSGLKAMSGRIEGAIARGLNEGGDKVRTRIQRSLKEQTGVKAYSSITSRMRTMRAFPEAARGPGVVSGALTYQIMATGKGIPIGEFPVKVTSKGVDAQTWGVDHLFKRSFRETDTGKLRARTTSSRFPVRALYGPSLPKELGHGQTPGVFYAAVVEFVGPAIVKHLSRAL